MQDAGSLRKRRRININKVTGLGTVPYKESKDRFNIHAVFSSIPPVPYTGDVSARPNGVKDAVSIQMSKIIPSRASSSKSTSSALRSSRVTRDPLFHVDIEKLQNDQTYGTVYDQSYSAEYQSSGPMRSNAPKTARQPVPKLISNRSTLLSNHTMFRLRQLLVLGVASFSFPWSWNKKEQRIDKWTGPMEKLSRLVWTFINIQIVLLAGFQMYLFLSRLQTDNGSYRPVFMSSFGVLWYIFAIILNLTMLFYMEDIRNYINTLLSLNKNLFDEYVVDLPDFKEDGQIFLMYSMTSNTMQIFISTSLFLSMPFQPWYLYSYIYSESNPWYWLIPGAVHEFVVVGQVISAYLLIGWTTVAHANSVSFWVQESHRNYESGQTIEELRTPEKALEVYRLMQILSSVFNNSMTVSLPAIKVINWLSLIPCGYVVFRSMNQKFIDEFPGILTYPLSVFDCFTCAFGLLQISAQMLDSTASFLTSWSETKHTALRKVLISCPLLKVNIGRLYFLTQGTVITYFQSIFDFITDSLLTFP